MLITYILFHGYPCMTKKNVIYSAGKIMEFILLIRDMPISVTCKFEMFIFKGSQVIKYYVMFAFLFCTVCSR